MRSAGPLASGKAVLQVLEHGPQPPRDLEVRRAVEPDLAAGELHEVIPVRRTVDDAQIAGGVVDHVVVQMTPADGAQQAVELVERQHGGGGIVDGARQRLDRDVDDDAEGEGGILLDGALGAHGDGRAQVVSLAAAAPPCSLKSVSPVATKSPTR